MGTHVVHEALLTPYVTTLISVKACQLVKRPGFRRAERRDLEQELAAAVLKQTHLYDPARGAVNTFIDRVVTSAAAMIVRERGRLKRGAALRTVSLDATPRRAKTHRQALGDLVDAGRVHRRVGDCDVSELDLANQAADLTTVLASLDPQLQEIARRLAAGNEAAVARDMGISRRQVRNAVAQIRQRFEEAGLGDS
jgi:hypothetical protein